MADAGFYFALPIRVLHPAGQSHGTVMLQHVAIQRVEPGIVDIRRDHALAKVIQHPHASHATQSAKRFLVQLGPDPRTGAEH